MAGDNPELGIYFNNLGELYRAEGDHTVALRLYSMGASILKRCCGPDHPDTILVAENLEALRKLDNSNHVH